MPDKNQSTISRRQFIKTTLGGGAGLLLLGPAACSPESRSKAGDWWFVQLTDTHNGTEAAQNNLQVVLQDIAEAFPQTEFVLTTGDVSEHGWAEELDKNHEIMQASEFTYYNLIGNHDARWSRTGQQAFIERFGGPHFAIEHAYLNVLALDSSVLLEQYGYLDPAELFWTENYLKQWQPKPTILAFHHPPSLPNRFLGSERNLYELIAQYNIPAVLAGHIHTQRTYKVNNCQIITGGSTHPPARGYNVYKISKDTITLYFRDPVEKITREQMRISNSGSKDVKNIDFPELKPIDGQIRIPVSEIPGKDYEAFVNGTLLETLIEGNAVTGDIAELGDGDYEILVCSPKETADVQQRRWGRFSKDTDSRSIRWQKQFESGIQCKPAYFEDLIIAGTNGGDLYGLSKDTGDVRWYKSQNEGAILSAPVIGRGKLYFGTPSGNFYCAEPSTGEILWKKSLDGSVIATARVTEEAVFIGTGDGVMYALNPESGEVFWEYRAQNMIKATPEFDGEHIYFGAWDGYFYCVNASNGALVWKKYINTPHFSPATCNPKIHGGLLYFVSHDYRTHCLKPKTGEIVWQFPGPDVEYQWNSPIVETCKPSYSSAIFHGNDVFFGSLTGHAIAFDRLTGERTAEIPISGPVFDSFPIKVNNRMYFGTTRGALCAVNLDSKQVGWEYSTGYDFIFSGAGTDGQSLAIGNLGGKLTVLDLLV